MGTFSTIGRFILRISIFSYFLICLKNPSDGPFRRSPISPSSLLQIQRTPPRICATPCYIEIPRAQLNLSYESKVMARTVKKPLKITDFGSVKNQFQTRPEAFIFSRNKLPPFIFPKKHTSTFYFLKKHTFKRGVWEASGGLGGPRGSRGDLSHVSS